MTIINPIHVRVAEVIAVAHAWTPRRNTIGRSWVVARGSARTSSAGRAAQIIAITASVMPVMAHIVLIAVMLGMRVIR